MPFDFLYNNETYPNKTKADRVRLLRAAGLGNSSSFYVSYKNIDDVTMACKTPKVSL